MVEGSDVLNGIAYDAKRKMFYLTGKNFPYIYEVSIEGEEKKE